MLEFLIGKAGTLVAVGAGILAAIVAIFTAGRRSGSNAEKVKQAKRDAQARSDQDALIKKARNARNGVRSTYDDLMSDDDGYRRD